MRETETDFKIGDAFQTDWSFHKDSALDEAFNHADCISIKVEHLITNDLVLSIDDIDEVSQAIKEIKELAEYSFNGDRTDRWGNEFSDTFEYFFRAEITDLLNDRLGYTWRDSND